MIFRGLLCLLAVLLLRICCLLQLMSGRIAFADYLEARHRITVNIVRQHTGHYKLMCRVIKDKESFIDSLSIVSRHNIVAVLSIMH